MTPRRSVAALVVALSMTALGISARDQPVELTSAFTSLGDPTMPFVPGGSFITSTWFCPGVPANEEAVGGSVEITNPFDEPIDGRITVYSSTAGVAPADRPITIEAVKSLASAATSIDVPQMDRSPIDLTAYDALLAEVGT